MSFRRGNLGFFTLQGFYWASYCPLFGYLVTILLDYGYSSEVCGMVTTLQCIAMMIIQPVYGYVVDQITTPKRGFIAIMSVGVVLAIPLPWVFGQATWFVVSYLTLLGLFIYSGGPVLDTWAVGVINKTRGMDYARCRGGGSVMYAFAALLVGNMLAPLGVQSLFVLHVVLGAGGVLVALFLVDSHGLDGGAPLGDLVKQTKPSFIASAKVLLCNRSYVIFTACMCLFNFGTRVYSTYMAMVIENVGGNSSHLGISLFISAFGELIFMLIASRLLINGLPTSYLYMLALGLLAARFTIMGLSSNLWVVVLTSVIQAAGFGFNLRMNAEYLVSTAPEGYQGMAIMLSGSISIGFGCVFGNLLGGYMINWWGVRTYIFICVAMFAAAMALFAPTVLHEHGQRKLMKRQMQERELAAYYNSKEQS